MAAKLAMQQRMNNRPVQSNEEFVEKKERIREYGPVGGESFFVWGRDEFECSESRLTQSAPGSFGSSRADTPPSESRQRNPSYKSAIQPPIAAKMPQRLFDDSDVSSSLAAECDQTEEYHGNAVETVGRRATLDRRGDLIRELKSKFELSHSSDNSNESNEIPVADVETKSPKPPPNSRSPELRRLLRSDHRIVPIVEKFVRREFPKAHIREEIPQQHRWEKIVRVGDSQKNAVIRLEHRLRIEQNSQNKPKQNTEKRSMNNESADLLRIVQKKITDGKELDWPELFVLKNAHCRYVIPREKLFRSLEKERDSERRRRRIVEELFNGYSKYQELLEKCRCIDDPQTQMAFLVMRAESYWYGARCCTEISRRSEWYRRGLQLYGELLRRARDRFPPADRSLLTVVGKISQIMLESCEADSTTMRLCREVIADAEKGLRAEIGFHLQRMTLKWTLSWRESSSNSSETLS